MGDLIDGRNSRLGSSQSALDMAISELTKSGLFVYHVLGMDNGYTLFPEKNILNIIDCCLKKKQYPNLIIFGTNISGTTGHQMTVQYSTSPMSVSALPGETRTNKYELK